VTTEPLNGPRVAVLDYGAGNLHSAEKALVRAGADARVTTDPREADRADALFIPGVGHFGQCVGQFREAGFHRLVDEWQAAGRPVLGVCVGMQILYEASSEAPDVPGLGVLPGRTVRLPGSVRVPHMGWNVVEAVRDDPVLEGVAGEYVYFVHSYYAEPAADEHVLATSPYGPGFPCVVRVGSVVATQFHPEKSSDVGSKLLRNWIRTVDRAGARTP
jgi:imidazole glycerol-phosphate synthase subunit HisH